MNDPVCKVSIITVSYNSAETIEQTIRSVLQQSYKNIEYIVIDGASTDGTQQIIERYADKLSYYLSEKDDGLYYAMNKGIQKATGDIIGIINSDDWYAETAVEAVVKCFNQSNAEAVYGLTVNVEKDGTKKLGNTHPLERIWYQAPFQHPSVFVKKEVYNRLGGFNTKYKVASDYDFLLRCYSKNIRFAYCDKVIAYFRRGGISETYGEVGCEENYKISMLYVDKCPYKKQVLTKIKESYEWSCFDTTIKNTKGMLSRLLCEYFQETITTVSIWETGVCGDKCCKILSREGVEVLCFADNDTAKWGTYCHGIEVFSPDRLQKMDIPVLIAVKEHGEDIKGQLSNMKQCVTIKQLKKMYCSTY